MDKRTRTIADNKPVHFHIIPCTFISVKTQVQRIPSMIYNIKHDYIYTCDSLEITFRESRIVSLCPHALLCTRSTRFFIISAPLLSWKQFWQSMREPNWSKQACLSYTILSANLTCRIRVTKLKHLCCNESFIKQAVRNRDKSEVYVVLKFQQCQCIKDTRASEWISAVINITLGCDFSP